MDNNELLQAIRQVVKEEVSAQVASIKEDISTIKEDIEVLKEDSAITRAGVNRLLDWADDASVQDIPISKVVNG